MNFGQVIQKKLGSKINQISSSLGSKTLNQITDKIKNIISNPEKEIFRPAVEYLKTAAF